MTGGGDATALKLAWAYVILRVLHSLVQATFNRVIVQVLDLRAGLDRADDLHVP